MTQLKRDYIKGSNGSANASMMTVQSVRAPGATTILTNTVAGVPTFFIGSMGTPHTFTDPVTGETITVISEATAVDFAGHIDSGHLEIDEIAPGYTDAGSAVGDIVIVRPTTRWADLVAEYLPPTGMVAPFAGSTAPDMWLFCDGASLLRADYPRLFAVIGTTYGAVDGTHFNVPDMRGRSPVGVGTGTFVETVASTAVTVASDRITISTGGRKQFSQAGIPVVLTTSGTAPGGLTAGNTYYLFPISSTEIQLASSLANAIAGVPIDITSQGTGNHTFTMTLTARALADRGGEETHALTINEIPSHTHSYSYKGAINKQEGSLGFTAASIDFQGATTGATGGSAGHNIMQPFLGLNYIIKT